jgi:hypothetical protein
MTRTRSLAILVSLALALGCAAPQPAAPARPAAAAPPATPVETKAFQRCYRQTKKTWLVDVVIKADRREDQREELLASFVGPAAEDQARARRYLGDLAAGKYATAEKMAGDMFATCMAGASEPADVAAASLCFQEQRILMHLMVARFDRKLSMEAAEAELLKVNHSEDGHVEAVIHRLVRDTYQILDPGSEELTSGPAFTEAQFLVCTDRYRHPS